MKKEIQQEIIDLYHTLGIADVDSVVYEFSGDEIDGRNFYNNEPIEKKDNIVNNYSASTK